MSINSINRSMKLLQGWQKIRDWRNEKKKSNQINCKFFVIWRFPFNWMSCHIHNIIILLMRSIFEFTIRLLASPDCVRLKFHQLFKVFVSNARDTATHLKGVRIVSNDNQKNISLQSIFIRLIYCDRSPTANRKTFRDSRSVECRVEWNRRKKTGDNIVWKFMLHLMKFSIVFHSHVLPPTTSSVLLLLSS